MDRGVTAIALGVVVGLIALTLSGWASDYVFPPSLQVDFDRSLGSSAAMPVMAVIVKLIGSAAAACIGGLVAVRSSERAGWPAWIVGGCLVLAAIVLHVWWPHPLWFLALRILAIIGAAYASGRLLRLAPAQA